MRLAFSGPKQANRMAAFLRPLKSVLWESNVAYSSSSIQERSMAATISGSSRARRLTSLAIS